MTLINNHKEFTDHLNERKKVILFNQNLHVISAIFGYKFLENRCLREIDNQSFYLLQEIFPSTAKSFGDQSRLINQRNKCKSFNRGWLQRNGTFQKNELGNGEHEVTGRRISSNR